MDNNEYTEVTKIIKAINELLKHMETILEEMPTIVLLCTNILPKKIKTSEDIYKKMQKMGYPLDYLNVEYNIEEAYKKIRDIYDRAKLLNLEDSLFELKVLLDYFDSLYGDFEHEKQARKEYEDDNFNFRKRLDKMNNLIKEIFSQIDDSITGICSSIQTQNDSKHFTSFICKSRLLNFLLLCQGKASYKFLSRLRSFYSIRNITFRFSKSIC